MVKLGILATIWTTPVILAPVAILSAAIIFNYRFVLGRAFLCNFSPDKVLEKTLETTTREINLALPTFVPMDWFPVIGFCVLGSIVVYQNVGSFLRDKQEASRLLIKADIMNEIALRANNFIDKDLAAKAATQLASKLVMEEVMPILNPMVQSAVDSKLSKRLKPPTN